MLIQIPRRSTRNHLRVGMAFTKQVTLQQDKIRNLRTHSRQRRQIKRKIHEGLDEPVVDGTVQIIQISTKILTITSSDVLTSNEDIWHRALPWQLNKRSLDSTSIAWTKTPCRINTKQTSAFQTAVEILCWRSFLYTLPVSTEESHNRLTANFLNFTKNRWMSTGASPPECNWHPSNGCVWPVFVVTVCQKQVQSRKQYHNIREAQILTFFIEFNNFGFRTNAFQQRLHAHAVGAVRLAATKQQQITSTKVTQNVNTKRNGWSEQHLEFRTTTESHIPRPSVPRIQMKRKKSILFWRNIVRLRQNSWQSSKHRETSRENLRGKFSQNWLKELSKICSASPEIILHLPKKQKYYTKVVIIGSLK